MSSPPPNKNASSRWVKWLRIGTSAVNWALLGTLATRFFSGGATGLVEPIGISLIALIGVIQGKDELTEGISEERKNSLTVVSFVLLVLVCFLQPFIAYLYNKEGKNQEESNKFQTAERNYLRSIAFDPNNPDPYYNLGNLYERWGDVDNAQKYYYRAVIHNLPDAINNLGRIYILQKKYPEAATLLYLTAKEVLLDRRQDIDDDVKYSLLKNYGWARFEQGDDIMSAIYLKKAIEIVKRSKVKQYVRNPGAAYCLIAKVRERQKMFKEAKESWKMCQQLIGQRREAEPIQPEEDSWLIEASKKTK